MQTPQSDPRPQARALARCAPLPDIVLVVDLARALGVTRRAARDWMRTRVPARKVGGRWIAERSQLLAALRSVAAVCADCCRPLPFAAAASRALPMCEGCATRSHNARQRGGESRQ